MPAPLVVNAAMAVNAATPLGDVAAFLARFLANTQDVLHRVYGVGYHVPPPSEVTWRLVAARDATTATMTEAIRFDVALALPDGGALFRAEMGRRGKVAQMMARVAQSPTGPA